MLRLCLEQRTWRCFDLAQSVAKPTDENLPNLRELFAKRSDVGSNISCLVSAEWKIRHLGMRIEEKKRYLFRCKIRLPRDHGKWGNISVCLFLIAGDHVA